MAYPPSGSRFFDSQICFGTVPGKGDDSAPKYFRYDLGRVARTIHPKICELVGSNTLGMECSEAGLIAE
jgi:hypothetical protein